MKINQLHPDLMSIGINLNVFPWCVSPSRLYMCGNMVPKSVLTVGRTTRKIITGWEKQYGEQARKIVAPSNMTVEEIFYVDSLQGDGVLTDAWNSIYIVFKNDEKNMFDLLELPRYNTQNTYIGFEYVYNKDVMRRLEKGATFKKGEVFGYSPRIGESGEWQFGMETLVACLSNHRTEEDGIIVSESYARDRLRCMFKHDREFGWNDSEYVPLYLYGTEENPRPFPENGEAIRPDGIVMGFRRRIPENALTSLTKKSLMEPDPVYDLLFNAPVGCTVMGVEVICDRMKDTSHNKKTEYIDQEHSRMLTSIERTYNEYHNRVIRWYEKRVQNNNRVEIPVTEPLDNFIRSAYGNYTRNVNGSGEINPLFRSFKRTRLKDWTIKILLKEEVVGKVRFKMSGLNGEKGVLVDIIPDLHMPYYPGTDIRAEMIVNNTPAFRRQIYSMLMELSINYINMKLHDQVKQMRKAGNYSEAFTTLLGFYKTGFPEFGEIVESIYGQDKDAQIDHVDYVCKTQISVQSRSDTQLYGADIIRALKEKYPFKPQKARFTNALGMDVETENPVLISSAYYMLLDKFGTDMSCQALPKSNLFGFPSKLNELDKYGTWYRDAMNRNTGVTESRIRTSQRGAQDVVKGLASGYSPEIRKMIVKRILRADDPFDINQIIKPEEYGTNRAVKMASSMLSDSGYTVRLQQPSDIVPDTNNK